MYSILYLFILISIEPVPRLELGTSSLPRKCSTAELHRHFSSFKAQVTSPRLHHVTGAKRKSTALKPKKSRFVITRNGRKLSTKLISNKSRLFLFRSTLFFRFDQLLFQSNDSLINGSLESIANLFSKTIVVLYLQTYPRLFIPCRFRLNYPQYNLSNQNTIMVLTQLRYFLPDECIQTFGHIKMNCLNSNFHILPSYLFALG